MAIDDSPGPSAPLPASAVRPIGEHGERLGRAFRRLLLDDVYRPELITSDIGFAYDPAPWNDWYLSHEWTWYADVSGRYLNALVSGAAATRAELPAKARQVAETVFASQSEDGHFGPERPLDACDRAQASGTAWMLLALPRYYSATGDARALEAARRLARWYAAVTPYWLRPETAGAQVTLGSYALIYSNFTHCLDGLAALWSVDPLDELRDLALRIARAVKPVAEEIHSHHFLSTLRGMLDWHRLTGEAWLLERARGEVDRIAGSLLLDTGGVPESFDSFASDEGCSEVDWVLVNCALFAATGERSYLEHAERALYGHLYLSQCPNGGFGHWSGFHRRFGPHGAGTMSRFTEAYWCCSMHGTFGLAEIARYAVTTHGDLVSVNLFVGVDAEIPLPGGRRARLRQSCLSYPHPGRVEIELEVPEGGALRLQVRLPAHSPLIGAELDGARLQYPPAQREITVELSRPGMHRLELRFAHSVRAEPCRRPDVVGDLRSLWYGPLPLGTNARAENVRYELTPEVLAAISARPAERRGAFPSEIELDLPASDAPGYAHTRVRRKLVLYPLAGHGYRTFSSLRYLF